jgi:hypothetical protein
MMITELMTSWDVAQHAVEQIGERALASAAGTGLVKGAGAALGWVRQHLPGSARDKLAAVEAAPDSGEAKAELTSELNKLLKAQPALAAELRGLLAEAGATTQTVGDHGRGVLIKGSNNEVKVG